MRPSNKGHSGQNQESREVSHGSTAAVSAGIHSSPSVLTNQAFDFAIRCSRASFLLTPYGPDPSKTPLREIRRPRHRLQNSGGLVHVMHQAKRPRQHHRTMTDLYEVRSSHYRSTQIKIQLISVRQTSPCGYLKQHSPHCAYPDCRCSSCLSHAPL